MSELIEAISSIGDTVYKNREEFLDLLEVKFKAAKITMPAPLFKVIWQELSERDETAVICKDKDGDPEPDSDLRDTENVLFGVDVHEYFMKEVEPFVADAWINESVRDHKDNELGKVGYEIPFTRYFYTYQPPRDLAEIESDIEKVENELLELLNKL